MLAKFLQREKRLIKSETIAFFVLPLVLLPLAFEVLLHGIHPEWFDMYREKILIANILYIVLARFTMLDTAVYIFSKSKNHVHLALIQIVLLYLEVTIITIVFYAVLFNMFDVFSQNYRI